MIDKLIKGLSENGERDTQNLETVRAQIVAIKSTHDALKEYIFQALLNIRSNENTQKKLELAVESLIEVRKYSDQEIERYTAALSLLSGKIQSVQETIALIDNMENAEDESKEVI
jgi:prefoldin subunit 5